MVCYDQVFHRAALDNTLIGQGVAVDKRAVRQAVLALPDGEEQWQTLQGQVYGRLMACAQPMPGVESFLRRCRELSRELWVVSHKTQYGHHDPARMDLRLAALTWMEQHHWFSEVYGLRPDRVYFADSRSAKVARIAQLQLGYFIDDLAEVLLDPGFPAQTRALWFNPAGYAPMVPVALSAFAAWSDMSDALLGG